MKIQERLEATDFSSDLERFWRISAAKIRLLESSWEGTGAPVMTAGGRYTSRDWTEWTQGFQYGSPLLQFEATGETEFLELAREKTVERMAPHLTHTGVHDHGFNNVSTYGTLLRLICESRIVATTWECRFYELALACSAAVQASRWTELEGGGFIYSFNGPHSLFADTMRTLRVLGIGHLLGHELRGEGDRRISLLDRLIRHAVATLRYNVYYGEGRDIYDVRGRVAHESIFNLNDGSYRCPGTQQGYSPFSTWTRGLSWMICGCAEQLEFLAQLDEEQFPSEKPRDRVLELLERAARATCDFYIENSPTDGIPYWDTGAPGLERMNDPSSRPADPFSGQEPVDSSAAAIAAQGLLRLGHFLGREEAGARYWKAGLTVLKTLLSDTYLCRDDRHEGLILHSLYHRPRDWDYSPDGSVPRGESTMWGDYHAREVCLYLQRIASDQRPLYFWSVAARGESPLPVT